MSDHKRWKFMAKFEIPDATDPTQIYLRRWNVITTPWFSLKVHNIRMPDADRALHDHPWAFGTFILKGGYLEELPVYRRQRFGEWRTYMAQRKRFSWHRIPAEGLHRIHEVEPDTWTFVISTGTKRQWGFAPRAGEWYPYWAYLGYEPSVGDLAFADGSGPAPPDAF
jgi:hypothetical protein